MFFSPFASGLIDRCVLYHLRDDVVHKTTLNFINKIVDCSMKNWKTYTSNRETLNFAAYKCYSARDDEHGRYSRNDHNFE